VKRALAYVVTGILLGVIIMLIPPLMVLPAYYRTLGTDFSLTPAALREASEQLGTSDAKAEQASVLGGITFPSSLLYAGVILALGLFSALGVYGFFKRRLMG